jgi:phosphoribulokinase
MSEQHPIIAITGSSGAGTTMIRDAFDHIFNREKIHAAYVDGDSFLRYERAEMTRVIEQSNLAGKPISHFGPDANRFDQLEALFKQYGDSGTGKLRRYIKDDEAIIEGLTAGTFSEESKLDNNSDLMLYEGLHGGVVASTWTRRRMSEAHNPVVIERRSHAGKKKGIDVAQYVDFLIGVVPVVNLEWIQKIHRDKHSKGIAVEETTTTILRRLQDYIYFMTPQFSLTDINFQRVPLVDTSNPFISLDVPTAAESMLVVRFREVQKFDIQNLLERFDGAFMSRPNTLVIPGGKLNMALEIICTPRIQELVKNARRLRGAA